MDNSNNPVNQIVSGLKGLASAFVKGNDTPVTEAGESKPTVTLRYSTEKVTLDADDTVMSKTVKQLFEQYADRLELPTSGNLGVRSDGKAVDGNSNPEPGRTYHASVARETKGN